MGVIEEIAAERRRQIEDEEWSVEHDDEHTDESLAAAAAAYALPESARIYVGRIDKQPYHRYSDAPPSYHEVKSRVPTLWPITWAGWWWKPKDRRRDLIRAAALIVAEIERLDRARQPEC